MFIMMLNVFVYVCRYLDADVYGIAVSLAKRYKISLTDVFMAHLEFLFDESG